MNTMKRLSLSLLVLSAVAVSGPAAAHEWGYHGYHGPRVSFGINLGYPLFGPAYYPEYYPAYYPAAVYAAPPAVVYQSAPAVVTQPPSQVVYQYYCPASQAYYPSVPTCVQPWLRVVPDGSVAN